MLMDQSMDDHLQQHTAFIHDSVTCAIDNMISCFISWIIGDPELMKSTQLLFVKFFTDDLPAMTLGVKAADPGVIDLRQNRNRKVSTARSR
jgi:magnesium-transporting ATPase (P-type)